MQEYITVSQLNSYIKRIFDSEEMLHNIPLLGEVYGVSFSRNVIYFSLKDESATIPCVCFYPANAPQIVEGAKLVCHGSPNYYTKAGKLNFNVIRVEALGQGKLYEEFLALKAKLEGEGLFDQSHKKPLPSKIERVGVITSKEGAVIQDIKNVAWRRNPSLDIVLYNTKVQGVGAEKEIAKAIELMGSYNKIDLIIVARGGGSLEDLSAYNTEIVARATYNCPKMIISAVGHETDYTIIDFVSDLRAPTPSAAAEIVVPNIADIKQNLSTYNIRLKNALKKKVELMQMRYEKCMRSRVYTDPLKIVNDNYLKLDMLVKSITNSVTNKLQVSKTQAIKNFSKLDALSPLKTLSRGYSIIEKNNGIVKSIADLQKDDTINIRMQDGEKQAKIL